jgi:methionine aminopeptidase
MRDGMVLTVEPFLSLGADFAEDGDDPWTLYRPDVQGDALATLSCATPPAW